MTLWTATDTANAAAEHLRGLPGPPTDRDLRDVFRYLLQLLDDYGRAVTAVGTTSGAALFADEPPATGDRRMDAALSALAEHLARRDGWRPPPWSRSEDRYAEPWWFVSGLKSWHAIAIQESPLSFRKRGVFITESALERA